MPKGFFSYEGARVKALLLDYIKKSDICPAEFEDVIKEIASVGKFLPELSVNWQFEEESSNTKHSTKPVLHDRIIQTIKKERPRCNCNNSEKSAWYKKCALLLYALKKYGFITIEGNRVIAKYVCEKLEIPASRMSEKFTSIQKGEISVHSDDYYKIERLLFQNIKQN